MLGAIIGDVVGSVYEFDNKKSTDFEFLTKSNFYTDDTILTVATAQALLESIESDFSYSELFGKNYKKFGLLYPSSYGPRFTQWLFSTSSKPYGSFGNGSAMRVSPIGWFTDDFEKTLKLAEESAKVTHSHPEGIKGAVVVAGCIFLARNNQSKDKILEFIKEYYSEDFLNSFTIDEIRKYYDFDSSCQGSVPQALEAFLEGKDFEDTIRKAVSIGGDSDTIAAIAGSIAEAYFGIPQELKLKINEYLEPEFIRIIDKFDKKINEPQS